MEKTKILLIFSKIKSSHFPIDERFIKGLGAINHKNIEVTYVIDPTRKELENLLQTQKYLCIMPFTQYTVKVENEYKYTTNEYLLSHLLHNLKINFFGSTYLTNLILNDKSIYAEMPLGAPVPKLVTRYNYMNQKDDYIELNNFFPIILEPSYTKNYLSVVRYQANSIFDISKIAAAIFDSDSDIEEIYLHKSIEFEREFLVSIIGNPPYSFPLLTVCDRHDSNVKVIVDNGQYSEIIANSYKAFHEYKFRDIGQFKYIYNEEKQRYFLVAADSTNGLNNRLTDAFRDHYDMNVSDILCLFLIVYLVRERIEDAPGELIKQLSVNLPHEIIEKIIPFAVTTAMHPSYSYRNICNELKGQFLQADERNRTDFIEYIKITLQQIPFVKNSNDVYLGKKENNYSFLDEYEMLPELPQNPQKLLTASTKILSGQMRWHSPTMLYNVNPPVMFNAIAATTLAKLYNPNAISSRASAGFIRMENQIIRQFAALLGWDTQKAAGIFTSGGKYCLIYAIKCGLNRCKWTSQQKPVVITSEINHFSIESVCNLLGIPGQCRRVPVTSEGTIDLIAFETVLLECFIKEIPVACIIFSGGNTTHSNVEDVYQGHQVVSKLVQQFNLNYTPYIYYDLVVGWPWIFYKYYDFKKNKLGIENGISNNIQYTLKKIQNVSYADGTGIDFHKGGFCPYTNSTFVSKDAAELYAISIGSIDTLPKEPHQYSLGNSRETSSILSAWNVLQSVGIQGFQSYIANMVTVAQTLAEILPTYEITVLQKDNTYGFATLIWASCPSKEFCYEHFCNLSKEELNHNAKYLYALSQYWTANDECSYQTRFLPNYRTIPDNKKVATISLLPMTLNIDQERAKRIANGLGVLKQRFDKKYLTDEYLTFGKMPDIVEK